MSCCHSSFELLLLLGTWPSAGYQRVDVLSQLLDISSALELLLGTWPCACYQRVDVLSQLFDSSLHVGFRNYQSSPTVSAVPSRVSLLISILRLNLVLTYGIPPEFQGGVHIFILNRHTPSGQS